MVITLLGPAADINPWLEIIRSVLSLENQVSVTGNFSGKQLIFNNFCKLVMSLALESL